MFINFFRQMNASPGGFYLLGGEHFHDHSRQEGHVKSCVTVTPPSTAPHLQHCQIYCKRWDAVRAEACSLEHLRTTSLWPDYICLISPGSLLYRRGVGGGGGSAPQAVINS